MDTKVVSTNIPLDLWEEMKEIIDDYNANRTNLDTLVTFSTLLRTALLHLLCDHRKLHNAQDTLNYTMIFDEETNKTIIINNLELKKIVKDYMNEILQSV